MENKPIEDTVKKMIEDMPTIDLPPCRKFLSTGSTLLDLAIAGKYPGGVGCGRIVHIFGGNSTAKSALAQEILGSAQRMGGHAIFDDVEGTLDFDRAGLFGLKTGKWNNPEVCLANLDKPLKEAIKIDPLFTYRHSSSIEEWFDDELGTLVDILVKKELEGPVALVEDSLSALPSKVELDSELIDATYGTSRAKQFSAGFRKYIFAIAELGITIIAVDQTRDNITGYGKSYSVSGGNAILFYSSTRILLKLKEKIKNLYDQVVGIRVDFEIEKNKVSAPHRKGHFNLLFDVGIDDITANFQWLKQHNILTDEQQKEKDELVSGYEALFAVCSKASERRRLKNELKDKLKSFDKKSGWWEFKGHKEQSLDKMVVYIEEENLEEELRQEVARVWNIVHQPTGRKCRHGDNND